MARESIEEISRNFAIAVSATQRAKAEGREADYAHNLSIRNDIGKMLEKATGKPPVIVEEAQAAGTYVPDAGDVPPPRAPGPPRPAPGVNARVNIPGPDATSVPGELPLKDVLGRRSLRGLDTRPATVARPTNPMGIPEAMVTAGVAGMAPGASSVAADLAALRATGIDIPLTPGGMPVFLPREMDRPRKQYSGPERESVRQEYANAMNEQVGRAYEQHPVASLGAGILSGAMSPAGQLVGGVQGRLTGAMERGGANPMLAAAGGGLGTTLATAPPWAATEAFMSGGSPGEAALQSLDPNALAIAGGLPLAVRGTANVAGPAYRKFISGTRGGQARELIERESGAPYTPPDPNQGPMSLDPDSMLDPALARTMIDPARAQTMLPGELPLMSRPPNAPGKVSLRSAGEGGPFSPGEPLHGLSTDNRGKGEAGLRGAQGVIRDINENMTTRMAPIKAAFDAADASAAGQKKVDVTPVIDELARLQDDMRLTPSEAAGLGAVVRRVTDKYAEKPDVQPFQTEIEMLKNTQGGGPGAAEAQATAANPRKLKEQHGYVGKAGEAIDKQIAEIENKYPDNSERIAELEDQIAAEIQRAKDAPLLMTAKDAHDFKHQLWKLGEADDTGPAKVKASELQGAANMTKGMLATSPYALPDEQFTQERARMADMRKDLRLPKNPSPDDVNKLAILLSREGDNSVTAGRTDVGVADFRRKYPEVSRSSLLPELQDARTDLSLKLTRANTGGTVGHFGKGMKAGLATMAPAAAYYGAHALGAGVVGASGAGLLAHTLAVNSPFITGRVLYGLDSLVDKLIRPSFQQAVPRTVGDALSREYGKQDRR